MSDGLRFGNDAEHLYSHHELFLRRAALPHWRKKKMQLVALTLTCKGAIRWATLPGHLATIREVARTRNCDSFSKLRLRITFNLWYLSPAPRCLVCHDYATSGTCLHLRVALSFRIVRRRLRTKKTCCGTNWERHHINWRRHDMVCHIIG